MTSSDDGGYVHDPSAFDDDGEPEERTESFHDADPEEVDREFDWRGWVLVGVIFLALIVAPVFIWLIPPEAGFYRLALIILPLFPAVALALVAVWATTRP